MSIEVCRQPIVENSVLDKLLRIKTNWAKKADHDFLNSFTTVHWGNIGHISRVLYKTRTPRELSCSAHNSQIIKCDFLGGVGIELKGKITLAGNGDLGTQIVKVEGKEVKVTHAEDRLLYDEASCISPFEFVVDMALPRTIYIDYEVVQSENYPEEIPLIVGDVYKLASDFNIPVILTE
jgi:hypothetical protein